MVFPPCGFMRLIGYYATWSIYARNCRPLDLQLNLLTHLTIAFAAPKRDGTFNLDEVRKVDFSSICRDNLKVGISIGGWGSSQAFSLALRDNFQGFIDSCQNLVNEFNLDYLEFDWEYPESVEDKELVERMLRMLKEQLPREGFEISFCLPCFQNNFIAKEIVPFVDFFILMAYDFVGPWSEFSGHHACLFPRISDHLEYLLNEEGIPSEIIVLGCPLYARTFSGCNGIGEKFEGPGVGSFGEIGAMDYKECIEKCNEIVYDSDSVGCYAVNCKDFLSFDSPQSIQRKCQLIQSVNIGGIAFWHMAADATDDNSLLKAASKELLEKERN